MGSYFFLSENVVFHKRKAYSIQDLLAEFGGIAALFLNVAQYLTKEITYAMVIGTFIKKIYMSDDLKHDKLQDGLKKKESFINFKFEGGEQGGEK